MIMRALIVIFIVMRLSAFSQTQDSQIGKDSICTKLLNQLIIDQINYERSRVGKPALKISKVLMSESKLHNDWMIKSNKYEHSHYSRGENIEVISSNSEVTYLKLAKEIVQGWMNSKGHRENILNSEYSHIGAAANFYSKEQSKFISPTVVYYLIKSTTLFYYSEK